MNIKERKRRGVKRARRDGEEKREGNIYICISVVTAVPQSRDDKSDEERLGIIRTLEKDAK